MTRQRTWPMQTNFPIVAQTTKKGFNLMTTYNTLSPMAVQFFLDDLLPMEHFNVIFLTSKGEQRQYDGFLTPSESKGTLVRFETLCGAYKSFKLDSVLSITKENS